jgi:hypothetical protein
LDLGGVLPVKPCRRPTKPPRPRSLKLRRKIASWNVDRSAEILAAFNGVRQRALTQSRTAGMLDAQRLVGGRRLP